MEDLVLAGINAAVLMIVGICEENPNATGSELGPRILAAFTGLDG